MSKGTSPIIHMLSDDHKRMIGLFRQYEGLSSRNTVGFNHLFEQIAMELEAHGRVLQECLYPELETLPQVEDARADQSRLMQAVNQLRSNPQQTDIRGLIEEVELHITKEETEIFPEIVRSLQEREQELAQKMQDLRAELIRQPQNQAAHSSQTQNPNGGEQKRRETAA